VVEKGISIIAQSLDGWLGFGKASGQLIAKPKQGGRGWLHCKWVTKNVTE